MSSRRRRPWLSSLSSIMVPSGSSILTGSPASGAPASSTICTSRNAFAWAAAGGGGGSVLVDEVELGRPGIDVIATETPLAVELVVDHRAVGQLDLHRRPGERRAGVVDEGDVEERLLRRWRGRGGGGGERGDG